MLKNNLAALGVLATLALTSNSLLAKLPAPTDEAKAKAAEAAAKTAWAGKVDSFLLCKAQDKVAAQYAKTAKAAGKEVKPAPALAACADPGPFVYTPAAASSPAPAASAAPATVPAAVAASKS